MDLSNLLNDIPIDPVSTLVLRHRPKERELRRVLPWLAVEKPEVFNAYQQTQGPKVEQQMLRASHVASFIGHEPGFAVFVGLYENLGSSMSTRLGRRRKPAFRELDKYEHKDTSHSLLWFDLVRTKHLQEWSGKLIIHWPPPEVAWSRWAGQNAFRISAILEESLMAQSMPNWRELVLSWDDLRIIPKRWRDTLSQWRGVYLIFDVRDRRGYVGSAYGNDNIRGRWENYAKCGHGGNKLLRLRNPKNFRFSILQRVSPDMPPNEVIELENTWKKRLHAVKFGLNEN